MYDLSYKAPPSGGPADSIISGIRLWGNLGNELITLLRQRVQDIVRRWVAALQRMPDFVLTYHNSATGKKVNSLVYSRGDRPAIAGMSSSAAEVLSQSEIVLDMTATAEDAVAREEGAGGDETTSAAGEPGPVLSASEVVRQFQSRGSSADERARQFGDVRAVVGSSADGYGYPLVRTVQDYINSNNHSDISEEDKTRLRSAAIGMWQTSSSQAAASSAGQIMYLLERLGYNKSGDLYLGSPRDGYTWILGQM